MRVTALLAAAFTLAACGSDKAAGPTTANNEQIISEMSDALVQAGDSEGLEFYLPLEVAITGLSAGAPVNPGNVTIDGHSYRFNTTSVTLEFHDSATNDVVSRGTLAVGWRHTNGDSLFLAIYGPSGGTIPLDRRTSVSLMQLPGSAPRSLESLAAGLRSGRYTVSRSISAGPDEPVLVLLKLGTKGGAAYAEDGIMSGSMSYAATSDECDIDALQSSELEFPAATCEIQRSSISLQANTWDIYSEEETPPAGPSITIPAQSVVGAKFTALLGPPPV
ncbi:MAG TPA: hypothetical protein VFR95_02195 [Gemmatimonadaceae bacterium]|nr:hypothetical protein [Gemmatimonadaceae bacterium]